MFTVGDSYPLGTAKGGDYITGAAQREIVVDGVARLERIIATPIEIDFEGQLCFSETSVRHMAQLLGMYDEGQVGPLLRDNGALIDQVAQLSEQLAYAVREVERLRSERVIATIYVAPDGSEFADKKSLVQRELKERGKLPKTPAAMSPDDAPAPEIPAVAT